MSALPVDELEEFAIELLESNERIGATVASAVTECDRVALARRQGSYASTAAYLASFTHGPTSAVAPARTNGRWLIDFPILSEAWAAGQITEDHVRELRKADNPRIHQLLIRDQQLHVDAAENLDWRDWCNHLSYWLLHADPDGSLPDDRKAGYGVRLRRSPAGDYTLSGTLDPLTGEALLTMIEHESEKLRRRELEEKLSPSDQTPIRELDLLALMRLTKRGFQRPDGGWPAPLINIVMSEQVAEDLISRMLDGDEHDPFELPLDFNDIDRRSETIRGTPLDPRRAWPALLVGRLRRQVMKAKERTKEYGRDARLFNAAQKQALLVESRGRCVMKGCDAPFRWLQADHIHPYGRGGESNLDDGQILCGPDNLRKSDNCDDDR